MTEPRNPSYPALSEVRALTGGGVKHFIGRSAIRLRTTLALGGVGLLFSGCLPTHSIGAMSSNRTCMDENAKFADAWTCVKAGLAGQTSGTDPKRDGFLEEGDLLAEQVRAGKVSDAEAKKRLAAGLSREIGQ